MANLVVIIFYSVDYLQVVTSTTVKQAGGQLRGEKKTDGLMAAETRFSGV